MSAQTIAVFPDTNVFLHYRPISEIDWCTLLKVRTVEIKIAPVVTRELEEQRVVNPSRKIRERATSAVKLLQKYVGQGHVRDGVTLRFLTVDPTVDYAAGHNLNLLLADDRLLGTYLLEREADPDPRCIVVTNDLPLTVKLTHRQIEFISLDESLLLPSEPDPLEKKAKQLEAELLRYKSREPNLAVTFANAQDHVQFHLAVPIELPDPELGIQAKLAAAKEKCKPIDVAPPPETVDRHDALFGIAQQLVQTSEQFQGFARPFWEDYNRRVDKYYRDYEKYLRDAVEFESLTKRTIKLKLALENSGTCPAEDIDVHLHFPDGFLLYDERRPPKPPSEPSAPSRGMDMFPGVSLLSNIPSTGKMPTLPDPTIPIIRKTNSYDVTLEIPKLKHGCIWTIGTFCIIFDSWTSVASFAIDYTVHAGNMIDEQTGRLGVIVEKSQEYGESGVPGILRRPRDGGRSLDRATGSARDGAGVVRDGGSARRNGGIQLLLSGAPAGPEGNQAIGCGVCVALFAASGLLFRHASLAETK